MKFIEEISQEKLRGGFYTPEPIANFILRWAINGKVHYDILEPSCGDGNFLKEIKNKKFNYNSITAIEIDANEAEKTSEIPLPKTTVLNQDFLTYCNKTKDRFDLVVGNPPYIRYQYFDKRQRDEAQKIFIKAELKYSKLTNAWVSFVVGSILLLKQEGKIGFVIPAEILQVSFAKQIRNYLGYFFNKIIIISFKKLIFPKVQQEVILLLCEKNGTKEHNIEHLELENADDLKNLDILKIKTPKKKIDFKSNKWTFYFLNQKEIDFIEKQLNQKEILPIRNFGTVEVGMTTGANKFFTVSKNIVNKYDLDEYAKPLVGRSVQVPSIIFSEKDWQDNINNGTRTFLLRFPKMKHLKQKVKALRYIERGEKDGIHKWYKNRIRDEWQIVPSAWISEALFIRRNNLFPRLVINKAKAYTTDTMHRVKINKNADIRTNKPIDTNAFIASYYNSLSFAFAEICGRSHGGGALELMPNEVEDILLPYDDRNSELLEKIDNMLRNRKTIDEILKITDEIILKERCGFFQEEIKLANNIWKKLQKRRLNRNGS